MRLRAGAVLFLFFLQACLVVMCVFGFFVVFFLFFFTHLKKNRGLCFSQDHPMSPSVEHFGDMNKISTEKVISLGRAHKWNLTLAPFSQKRNQSNFLCCWFSPYTTFFFFNLKCIGDFVSVSILKTKYSGFSMWQSALTGWLSHLADKAHFWTVGWLKFSFLFAIPITMKEKKSQTSLTWV